MLYGCVYSIRNGDVRKMKLQDFESRNIIKLWFSSKSNQAVITFRLSQWLYKHNLKLLANLIKNRNIMLTGADIAPSAQIGAGLRIGHPAGIVISGKAKIGQNLFIQNCVTIGTRDHEKWDANVVIGDSVEIGSGAKILGNISVGDYAKIGANAVVLTNIPEGGTAVGVPARVINR